MANFTGIRSLEFGVVQADDTLPSSFDISMKVKETTGVLTLPEADTTSIFTEDSPVAFAVVQGNLPESTFVGEILNMSLEDFATLTGGTRTPATSSVPERLTIPLIRPNIFRAVKVTSFNNDGDPIVLGFYRARINIGISGTITKTDLIGTVVTATFLAPTSGTEFYEILNGNATA